MREDSSNGALECPIKHTWADTKTKINDIHMASQHISRYLSHLEKLDALTEIKDKLLDAATGRDERGNKNMLVMARILGGVIIFLTAAIVFIVTSGHLKVLPLIP